MPRVDVPPAGKAKPFDAWAAAIVAGVRTYLPNVRAVRKGSRLVIIRHSDREAHLKIDGTSSACCVTFTLATIATTLASMFDERRDDFTVGNIAHTIAGYFDARFTRAT